MVLPAAGAVGAHRDDHVGPRHANQPDVVAEDLVVAPLLERLLDAEREAEVHGAREELLGAVEAVRGQQLLGAQHAERLEQLRADLVLAAVAARRRREHDAQPLPVALHRQQRVVLVVGMRGRVHDRADGGELPEHQREPRLAPRISGALGADTERHERKHGREHGHWATHGSILTRTAGNRNSKHEPRPA